MKNESVAVANTPSSLALAAELAEDLVDERDARERAGGLGEKVRGALRVADDEAAVVEGRRVLREPRAHLRRPARREEVRVGVLLWCGHRVRGRVDLWLSVTWLYQQP